MAYHKAGILKHTKCFIFEVTNKKLLLQFTLKKPVGTIEVCLIMPLIRYNVYGVPKVTWRKKKKSIWICWTFVLLMDV